MITEIINSKGNSLFVNIAEIAAVVDNADPTITVLSMRSGNIIEIASDYESEAEILRRYLGGNLEAYHAGKYNDMSQLIDPRYIRKMEK